MLLAIILGALVLVVHMAKRLFEETATVARLDGIDDIARISILAAMLVGTAFLFGLFLYYPLVREQVREDERLRAMADALSERSESMELAALTDGLTGLKNRRFFDEALREYIDAFRSVGRSVGLVMIDLDHFKSINDRFGHDIGDEVLRTVAYRLAGLARHHDVVARLGGEEFALIVPNLNYDQLVSLVETMRISLAGSPVSCARGQVAVTASFGLALWNGSERAGDLYRRTDRLLYAAKNTGRNCVCA
ncbi:GGDEF domain-containing protein [Limoniibacter endophyticus]|uniref:GGDEF domain-containing protein n=1 Tax=Limoniibacter endophyticus TaxID=1565040 RepID=UPI001FCED608|nr:GGDEF domain-containing protein [Limoniibacter endophyticus]